MRTTRGKSARFEGNDGEEREGKRRFAFEYFEGGRWNRKVEKIELKKYKNHIKVQEISLITKSKHQRTAPAD